MIVFSELRVGGRPVAPTNSEFLKGARRAPLHSAFRINSAF